VVRRVPGRGGGTFVAKGKIERDLSRIVGVPALLRSQGVVAGTRVLSARLAEADDVTAQALRARPGELVIDLVRIRLTDGSPFSLEHAKFPAGLRAAAPSPAPSLSRLPDPSFPTRAASATAPHLWERQRWTIVVVRATSMVHRCGRLTWQTIWKSGRCPVGRWRA